MAIPDDDSSMTYKTRLDSYIEKATRAFDARYEIVARGEAHPRLDRTYFVFRDRSSGSIFGNRYPDRSSIEHRRAELIARDVAELEKECVLCGQMIGEHDNYRCPE